MVWLLLCRSLDPFFVLERSARTQAENLPKFLLVLLIVCVVAWESVGSTRTLRRIYTRRRPTIAPLASCPEPFTAPGTIKYNCNPPYVHGEACWWRCPPRSLPSLVRQLSPLPHHALKWESHQPYRVGQILKIHHKHGVTR
uniref:Uncharacterized protein n=1 Tax=Branchiostoma floridae TaxID=7739 RepID=C3YWI3_BRAFL|eukprot:XP_002599215.1 hypothetical protein BRAFLDRAFT_64433 [Branchiostoma floridae]